MSGDVQRQETAVPEFLRQAIELFEARPLTCVGVVVATILYLKLMLSDPRIR